MWLFDGNAPGSKPMPFTSEWSSAHAISEDDYYSRGYQGDNPNSIMYKLSDWLGITNTRADYDAWVAGRNAWYEQKATNSARAWDEYMQSTQYQRMVRDLKAAGLNPWLALQGASLNSSYQTTAGHGSSARYNASNSKSEASSIALLLVSAARLIAALA